MADILFEKTLAGGTTLRFFDGHPDSPLREVRFCNFDQTTSDIFLETFRDYFSKD